RTGAKVVKARRIRSGADIAALGAFHTDFHLLDAYRPGRWGGTGETFDWELVAARRTDVPVILSGGLTPENVGGAIAAARPFAVRLRASAGRPSPMYLAERLSEAAGARCGSSARTSTTPARTRSTTRSARRCSPAGWASGASSPRPAPGSTASRRRPRAPCSA